VGEYYFTLLEASPLPGVDYEVRERIFIGRGGKSRVDHVLGRISYDDLSSAAKAELPQVLEFIVAENEERFVRFFNEAPSLTPRMHSLELIPGIGKRLMFNILELREREPFTSFEDLRSRAGLNDPVKMVARRIIDELRGGEKYHLFARPYSSREEA